LDTPTAVVSPSSTASFKLSMSAEFENVGNGKWIYHDENHGHIFTQLLINTSIKDCISQKCRPKIQKQKQQAAMSGESFVRY
jgi:hypothetical protein